MVYLDFAATTPIDPRVLSVFVNALEQLSGNPSSGHSSGSAAASAMSESREKLAGLVGRTPPDIIATAGASEALAIGIVGTCLALPSSRRHILVGSTEHKAVYSAIRFAERLVPLNVSLLPVDADGQLQMAEVSRLLGGDVGLVITMLANNETGTLFPIGEVVDRARQTGALVMCDITQAIGKIPLDSAALNADMLALSAHKFYGPKGVGALVATREARRQLVTPLGGGGQEAGLRGGTSNVPGIVAMGSAAELVQSEVAEDAARAAKLADLAWDLIQRKVPGVRRLGLPGGRIESVISFLVPAADSEEVLNALEFTEISAGSACNAGNPEPSHVLLAMGLSADEATKCLRVSLGRMTTEADIRRAVDDIAAAVAIVRHRNQTGV